MEAFTDTLYGSSREGDGASTGPDRGRAGYLTQKQCVWLFHCDAGTPVSRVRRLRRAIFRTTWGRGDSLRDPSHVRFGPSYKFNDIVGDLILAWDSPASPISTMRLACGLEEALEGSGVAHSPGFGQMSVGIFRGRAQRGW